MKAGSIFVTDGYPELVVLPKMVKTGGENMATPAGGPTKDLYQLPFKGWLPYRWCLISLIPIATTSSFPM